MRLRAQGWPLWGLVLAAAVCPLAGGCAALTNPVADGIPVRELPPDLTTRCKCADEILPLSWLGQDPPAEYRLDTGDVLGIWVEGVVDDKNPLILARVPDKERRFPERGDIPSSVGYPIAIGADGNVSLPLVKALSVRGQTIREVEDSIRKAYTDAKILLPGRDRTFVTLQHKRLHHVVVFRQDIEPPGSANANFQVTNVGSVYGGSFLVGGSPTGVGNQIDLPAYENDLLHALALTGGLPGSNGSSEIIIFRKRRPPDRKAALEQEARLGRAPAVMAALGPPKPEGDTLVPAVRLEASAQGSGDKSTQPKQTIQQTGGTQPGDKQPPREHTLPMPNKVEPRPFETATRIRLRSKHGEALAFAPEDVILQTGDVVVVAAAPVETFYTGGLLPSGEYILPRDYELDVVEAVMRVRGPVINGAFGGSNLSGALINPGIGNPSPRLVTVIRKTPDGGQIPIRVDLFTALRDPRERLIIRHGDVLIMQETRAQALARYFTQQVKFTGLYTLFLQRDAIGTVTTLTP